MPLTTTWDGLKPQDLASAYRVFFGSDAPGLPLFVGDIKTTAAVYLLSRYPHPESYLSASGFNVQHRFKIGVDVINSVFQIGFSDHQNLPSPDLQVALSHPA